MKQFLFSLILMIATCRIAVAQNDTLTYRAPELTVTASHAFQNTPVTFVNYNDKWVDRKSVGQEPSLLLARGTGFTAYTDAGSGQGYSYFRLRGLDQTRINMSLDGVPLNELEDQGVYFSNYPDILNSVSNIQVQRGVGTSKNGNASYAGSVQLTSVNLNAPAYVNIGADAGAFNTYRGYAEANSGNGVYTRLSSITSNGYRDYTGNTSNSIFIKAGNNKLSVTGFAGLQENNQGWLGVPLAQINSNRKTNVNTRNETDNFLQTLLYVNYNVLQTATTTVSVTPYVGHLDGHYFFDLNNFLGGVSDGTLYQYNLSSETVGAFTNIVTSLPTNGILTLNASAHTYERSHIGYYGTVTDLDKLYTNSGVRNDYSANARIEQPFGNVHVYADVQLRNTSFEYTGTVDIPTYSWTFVNPRAGLSYTTSVGTFYAMTGRTGREPTRNDMFGGNDDLPDNTLYITTPEWVVNTEVGYRVSTPTQRIGINVYSMDFTNEITLNGNFGPNGIALTRDVDKSYRRGVELEYDIELNNTWLSSNATLSHNQITDQGQSFSPLLTPNVTSNVEVGTTMFGSITLSTALRYQGRSWIDFSNTESIPAHVVNDVSAWYSNNLFTITVRVNNVFNEDYFTNGYVDWNSTARYHVSAPRNVTTSIKFSL